jgi:hypothetical protein
VRIDFHPQATFELEQSLEWYAARSAPAAQNFATAIEAALAKIAHDPGRFLQIDRRHRACSVEGFPFQIVYRVEGHRMYVVGVAHAKRRPGYWRRRK